MPRREKDALFVDLVLVGLRGSLTDYVGFRGGCIKSVLKRWRKVLKATKRLICDKCLRTIHAGEDCHVVNDLTLCCGCYDTWGNA
jgi:hypothetical protein